MNITISNAKVRQTDGETITMDKTRVTGSNIRDWIQDAIIVQSASELVLLGDVGIFIVQCASGDSMDSMFVKILQIAKIVTIQPLSVVLFPTGACHLLGQLLETLGKKNVKKVIGTDTNTHTYIKEYASWWDLQEISAKRSPKLSIFFDFLIFFLKDLPLTVISKLFSPGLRSSLLLECLLKLSLSHIDELTTSHFATLVRCTVLLSGASSHHNIWMSGVDHILLKKVGMGFGDVGMGCTMEEAAVWREAMLKKKESEEEIKRTLIKKGRLRKRGEKPQSKAEIHFAKNFSLGGGIEGQTSDIYSVSKGEEDEDEQYDMPPSPPVPLFDEERDKNRDVAQPPALGRFQEKGEEKEREEAEEEEEEESDEEEEEEEEEEGILSIDAMNLNRSDNATLFFDPTLHEHKESKKDPMKSAFQDTTPILQAQSKRPLPMIDRTKLSQCVPGVVLSSNMRRHGKRFQTSTESEAFDAFSQFLTSIFGEIAHVTQKSSSISPFHRDSSSQRSISAGFSKRDGSEIRNSMSIGAFRSVPVFSNVLIPALRVISIFLVNVILPRAAQGLQDKSLCEKLVYICESIVSCITNTCRNTVLGLEINQDDLDTIEEGCATLSLLCVSILGLSPGGVNVLRIFSHSSLQRLISFSQILKKRGEGAYVRYFYFFSLIHVSLSGTQRVTIPFSRLTKILVTNDDTWSLNPRDLCYLLQSVCVKLLCGTFDISQKEWVGEKSNIEASLLFFPLDSVRKNLDQLAKLDGGVEYIFRISGLCSLIASFLVKHSYHSLPSWICSHSYSTIRQRSVKRLDSGTKEGKDHDEEEDDRGTKLKQDHKGKLKGKLGEEDAEEQSLSSKKTKDGTISIIPAVVEGKTIDNKSLQEHIQEKLKNSSFYSQANIVLYVEHLYQCYGIASISEEDMISLCRAQILLRNAMFYFTEAVHISAIPHKQNTNENILGPWLSFSAALISFMVRNVDLYHFLKYEEHMVLQEKMVEICRELNPSIKLFVHTVEVLEAKLIGTLSTAQKRVLENEEMMLFLFDTTIETAQVSAANSKIHWKDGLRLLTEITTFLAHSIPIMMLPEFCVIDSSDPSLIFSHDQKQDSRTPVDNFLLDLEKHRNGVHMFSGFMRLFAHIITYLTGSSLKSFNCRLSCFTISLILFSPHLNLLHYQTLSDDCIYFHQKYSEAQLVLDGYFSYLFCPESISSIQRLLTADISSSEFEKKMAKASSSSSRTRTAISSVAMSALDSAYSDFVFSFLMCMNESSIYKHETAIKNNMFYVNNLLITAVMKQRSDHFYYSFEEVLMARKDPIIMEYLQIFSSFVGRETIGNLMYFVFTGVLRDPLLVDSIFNVICALPLTNCCILFLSVEKKMAVSTIISALFNKAEEILKSPPEKITFLSLCFLERVLTIAQFLHEETHGQYSDSVAVYQKFLRISEISLRELANSLSSLDPVICLPLCRSVVRFLTSCVPQHLHLEPLCFSSLVVMNRFIHIVHGFVLQACCPNNDPHGRHFDSNGDQIPFSSSSSSTLVNTIPILPHCDAIFDILNFILYKLSRSADSTVDVSSKALVCEMLSAVAPYIPIPSRVHQKIVDACASMLALAALLFDGEGKHIVGFCHPRLKPLSLLIEVLSVLRKKTMDYSALFMLFAVCSSKLSAVLRVEQTQVLPSCSSDMKKETIEVPQKDALFQLEFVDNDAYNIYLLCLKLLLNDNGTLLGSVAIDELQGLKFMGKGVSFSKHIIRYFQL
ncbi:hypothetical protein ADUPG1_000822 [Aduncisulcus paluster]|uniref:Uncharacterized protein n=1 Tax=Aduncisulcus paluster TaxID=2918883 RepID=A0ABQ5KCW2_9EUKA|nr:hypothetical protein ADUPG1_000822 [Aduncisulcus paluster]